MTTITEADVGEALADQLLTFPQLNTFYVGFKTGAPPFNDPLVRRALILTLDREEMIETIYGGGVLQAKGLLLTEITVSRP